MKEVKTVRFETSDGRRFESREKALGHEITTKLQGMLKEDEKLTVPKVIDLIIGRPEDVIPLVQLAMPQAEAAE